MFLTRVSIVLLILCFASSKIYKRCELARELRNFDMPEEEIPTWVCIAHHESNFDTTAMNPGSGDHGLFQISQLYWCSPPGDGYGCNSPCSKFRDDDIADDLQCIRRIHNEHRRISGDGFNAWVVYPLHCKEDNSNYTRDCLYEESPSNPDSSSNVTDNEIPTEDVDKYGDGYHFPALPGFSKELETKTVNYGDGYEFPKLPYSKTSIHESVPIKNTSGSSSKRTSRNEVIFKLPFSSSSIHVSHSGEGKESLKLPYSKGSIHYYVSADEKSYAFPKFPASKHSIHHFITTNSEKQLRPDEFPLQKPNPDLNSSIFATPSTIFYYNSTKSLIADLSPPTRITYPRNLITLLNEAENTTRHYTPTAEIPLASRESEIFPEKFGEVLNSSTPKVLIDTLSSMSPINKNQLINESLVQRYSTNELPKTTLNPPFPFMNNLLNTVSSEYYRIPKNFTTSTISYLFTSENKNQTSATERSTIFDFIAASSTPALYRTSYSSPSTASAPYTAPASSDLFKSTTTRMPVSSYPFTFRKNFTDLNITNLSRKLHQITTTKPGGYTTTTNSLKHLTTLNAGRISDTTLRPSGKQVTFAPDSFFSWLFNSQTLPPLIRPPRPNGDRPGGRPTTARPGIGERPSGFPRPGASQTSSQPSMGSSTTRRPFPTRPNMMSRPSRPQRRPFPSSRPLANPPRRPFRKGVASNSEMYIVNVTEKVNKDEITSVVRATAASPFGRSGKSKDDNKEKETKIKLDDHFVYVRTKYGYRLFRT